VLYTGGVGPSWVVLLSAVLCIIILMLPLSTDQNITNSSSSNSTLSLLYSFIIVSLHQKLIAAYILGIYVAVDVMNILKKYEQEIWANAHETCKSL